MKQTSARFSSLDVFRGMTIVFMILVNTPGSGAKPFSPLVHSSWFGFTLADLVFPSFLFAMGNSMCFSMKKFAELSNTAILLKIFKRTVLLFIIGYLMYWFPFFSYNNSGNLILSPISQTRIMGVLQRIALCYLIASLMIHYLSTPKVILLSILFLVGYWIFLLLGNPGDPYSLTGHAGHFIDEWLLGRDHLYKHTIDAAYDPEGLISTFPAIVNVIIGYFAGKLIRQKGIGYEAIAKLMIASTLLITIAFCWNLVFPFCKKIWTSSFTLLTSGIDLAIIAVIVYIVDVVHWHKWNWTKFFTIFGMNSLFIYVLSELLKVVLIRIPVAAGTNLFDWINRNIFQVVTPGATGSLLFALFFMLICWSVGWILDKRKIYIKL